MSWRNASKNWNPVRVVVAVRLVGFSKIIMILKMRNGGNFLLPMMTMNEWQRNQTFTEFCRHPPMANKVQARQPKRNNGNSVGFSTTNIEITNVLKRCLPKKRKVSRRTSFEVSDMQFDVINTIESDSDSITSSEVSSDENTDSDTSSRLQYGEGDDSINQGVYIV